MNNYYYYSYVKSSSPENINFPEQISHAIQQLNQWNYSFRNFLASPQNQPDLIIPLGRAENDLLIEAIN